MATYAALVSVTHIIDNLRLHCRPPVILHKEQAHLLTQKLTFLQEFLQLYNPNLDYSKEADPLEARIAGAAYAAENAIESHILDQFANNNGENMSSDSLYQELEKVIEDMALIEEEAMEIKETMGSLNRLHYAKPTPPAVDSSGSSSSSSIAQKKGTMVGADDLLLEMKDKLFSSCIDVQTIPIVGMGGSGKSTLALNIYQDRLIVEHFYIRAWVTFSQEYRIREILIQLLTQLIEEPNQNLKEGDLGDMIYKHLFGRRYMIVLDDMWSLKAWDGVRRFLPNNKNGSRIIITTRLTTLASALPNSNSLEMKLLGGDASWDLLSKTAFVEKGCRPEFEEIGKRIGKSCKGLPLSIVVVGGLLAKSEQSIKSWKLMEENLNEIVNLDDDEGCLKILYMSYKQLPVHLKPCFLYMGIYREDHVICISKLVKLWVVEGFLKPISGKRPEDVARAYIKDLIDRNLIMIHKLGSIGSVKECKVHDLLRDLCLREAQKQGFYDVLPEQEIDNEVCRGVISGTIPGIEELDVSSSVRSLITHLIEELNHQAPQALQMLRILCSGNGYGKNLDNNLVNLRFLKFTTKAFEFPSVIWQFWNLQTLIVSLLGELTAPSDIWYMSNIRHLYLGDVHLPDPPPNVQDDGIVLSNLQTLGNVRDFKCSEEVVRRIPNIRKLGISYDYEEEEGVEDDRFCLTNLDSLDKLESLNCTFHESMSRMSFPRSLIKLRLRVSIYQCWQDILDKIGELPLLEKLHLRCGTFKEGVWETSEGQFRRLKFLSLKWCNGLKVWTSEASHFPRLEHLRLRGILRLEEFPSDFADMTTLRLIDLADCCDSIVESAKRILEEQEDLYGEEDTTLQVQVQLWYKNNPKLAESLKSLNFHIALPRTSN